MRSDQETRITKISIVPFPNPRIRFCLFCKLLASRMELKVRGRLCGSQASCMSILKIFPAIFRNFQSDVFWNADGFTLLCYVVCRLKKLLLKVLVTNIETDGCQRTSDTLTISIKPAPLTPSICLVTVDSLGNNNEI